jgi:hypothetical protein
MAFEMPDTVAHVYQPEVAKIAKSAANYTDAAPEQYKDEPCRTCTYFERIAPDHCSRVKGIIAAAGHCRLWETKK